jgi:hypothetical protein
LRVDSTEVRGFFLKKDRRKHDLGRSWDRSYSREIRVTWPRWLGLFWCKNRIKEIGCIYSARKTAL